MNKNITKGRIFITDAQAIVLSDLNTKVNSKTILTFFQKANESKMSN